MNSAAEVKGILGELSENRKRFRFFENRLLIDFAFAFAILGLHRKCKEIFLIFFFLVKFSVFVEYLFILVTNNSILSLFFEKNQF